MIPLRQQMLAALQLSGTGERTQEASVREVRLRSQCFGTSPDLLSDPELHASCLHRKNVDHLAPASMRLCSSGMRFFSQHVRTRDWHTLSRMRAHTAPRLPAVRSVQAVRRLRRSAPLLHHQGSCTTVDSLGLRLPAALSLPVADIASQPLPVHIQRGKGAQDRYVPLPAESCGLIKTDTLIRVLQ